MKLRFFFQDKAYNEVGIEKLNCSDHIPEKSLQGLDLALYLMYNM